MKRSIIFLSIIVITNLPMGCFPCRGPFEESEIRITEMEANVIEFPSIESNNIIAASFDVAAIEISILSHEESPVVAINEANRGFSFIN